MPWGLRTAEQVLVEELQGELPKADGLLGAGPVGEHQRSSIGGERLRPGPRLLAALEPSVHDPDKHVCHGQKATFVPNSGICPSCFSPRLLLLASTTAQVTPR